MKTSEEYRKMGLDQKEIKNLFYGHALDLADEMGCFHAAVKEMSGLVTVEQLESYCKFLEDQQTQNRGKKKG